MEKKIAPKPIEYCSVCGRRTQDTNDSVCESCLNAESIIVDGLDIHNQGLDGPDPVDTALGKVKLLIKNGWQDRAELDGAKIPPPRLEPVSAASLRSIRQSQRRQ